MRRFFEKVLCASALLLLAPLLAATSVAIVLDSGFPILFTQTRIGRNARSFRLWKFRTMQANTGLPLTLHCDPRVTNVGRLLRRCKIDELPQLFNILGGSMSFIGPRPEVPLFVDHSEFIWQRILSVRPGLFDPAYLAWRNEDRILAISANPADEYRRVILPQKLAISLAYLEYRTLWTDLELILKIVLSLVQIQSVKLGL